MKFSDEQLAQKSKQGDKDAFEQLIKNFQKPIYTLCFRHLGNSNDALDAAQETFIRVYHKLNLYNENFAFRPWLYKIAVNICKDFLKNHSREKLHINILETSFADPKDSLETALLQEDINNALNKLPEKYKMAIILKHIKMLEYKEIAEILRLPVNTVKTHVKRGRELLQKELKEVGHYE